jgi:TolB-like protein
MLIPIDHRNGMDGRERIMTVVGPETAARGKNLNVRIANLHRIQEPEVIVTLPLRGLQFTLELGQIPAALTLSDPPSVVVLPFSTFDGDPDPDWLSDAFIEDIPTEPPRFRDFFKVARHSAFLWRPVPGELREFVRDFGVRPVVEGRVCATPERGPVTVQLIAATNDGHVWAGSLDRNMNDPFETQAILARAVATWLSLQRHLAKAGRLRVLRTADLTALEFAQHALSAIPSEKMTCDSGPPDRAAVLAWQSLVRDPRSSLAPHALARVTRWSAYHTKTSSVSARLADGIHAAPCANAIDAGPSSGRSLLGRKREARASLFRAAPGLPVAPIPE